MSDVMLHGGRNDRQRLEKHIFKSIQKLLDRRTDLFLQLQAYLQKAHDLRCMHQSEQVVDVWSRAAKRGNDVLLFERITSSKQHLDRMPALKKLTTIA